MPEALRIVTATRYVTPLREGGSLPGLMEADDDGLYVTKLRGAGQGDGALLAEVVAGELARALGLPVPELVLVEGAAAFAQAEPDPEIQELLAGSTGVNVGMDFLPGALPFALPPDPPLDAALAADVVWLDALVTNVDRTHRNPNLLCWHDRTWLIDHGAAFFRQHGTAPLRDTVAAPTPGLADHVLLGVAGPLGEAHERLAARAREAVDAVVALPPDAWLGADPAARRADFAAFLHGRIEAAAFVEEAELARSRAGTDRGGGDGRGAEAARG